MTDDKWKLYNVGAQHAGSAQSPGAKGFLSSVFDGRYMYFVPYSDGTSGVVTRYDTQAGFGAAGSWSIVDIATATSNAAAKGFFGGAFDGRYVYFVPHNNAGSYHGTIARYDTQGAFESAWTTFDISSVKSSAKGFATAAFDGRYLYLAPYNNNAEYSSTVARYDTQADFSKTESWSTFDVSQLNDNARGFLGSAFDGRYLYLIPHYKRQTPGDAVIRGYHGNIARYDTKASSGFTSKDAWTTFNTETLAGQPAGFWGVVFDGRYLYMAQHRRTPAGPLSADIADGWVARHDTQADLDKGWETFNVATLEDGTAKGFAGATFDGRYIYLVPSSNLVNPTVGGFDGIVARYDTMAPFGQPGSWERFNLASKDPTAIGYSGAGFDGKYLYLVPRTNATGAHGLVAQFDTKSPSWLPVGWNYAFD